MRALHEGRSLWRLFDPNPRAHGCLPVLDPLDALKWNREGWGIFWTVNEFRGPRVRANLVRILSWIVETDEGTKEEQLAALDQYPEPSAIIESKRGFHVYYDAAPGADPANWNAVVLDRLVYALKGDPNARDLCRILRVPGFDHAKNPDDRFPIEVIHESGRVYTEAEMLEAFPAKPPPAPKPHRPKARQTFGAGESINDRIWRLDCEDGLARLSGSGHVNGEVFTFSRTGRGRKNIIVNGQQTSCFIDENGRIGSLDNGGPTLFMWLKWYGHSAARCYQILEEYYPELKQGLKK